MVDDIQSELLELDTCRSQAVIIEQKLELRLLRINDLKLALELSDKSLEALKRSVAASEEIARALERRAQAAEQAAMRAEDRAGRWYRSPLLWFSAGIVLSIGGAVAVYKISE
jgi:anti-sigma-K factor RskA